MPEKDETAITAVTMQGSDEREDVASAQGGRPIEELYQEDSVASILPVLEAVGASERTVEYEQAAQENEALAGARALRDTSNKEEDAFSVASYSKQGKKAPCMIVAAIPADANLKTDDADDKAYRHAVKSSHQQSHVVQLDKEQKQKLPPNNVAQLKATQRQVVAAVGGSKDPMAQLKAAQREVRDNDDMLPPTPDLTDSWALGSSAGGASVPGAFPVEGPEGNRSDGNAISSSNVSDHCADHQRRAPESPRVLAEPPRVLEATLAESPEPSRVLEATLAKDPPAPAGEPNPVNEPTPSVIGDLVEGTVFKGEESTGLSRRETRFAVFGLLVLFVTILLLALGLSGVFSKGNDDDQSVAPTTNLRATSTNTTDIVLDSNISSWWSPTLEAIQKTGVLKCGYVPGIMPPYLLNQSDDGSVMGFVGDLYNAIAAAANVKVQLVPEQQMRNCLINNKCNVLMLTFVHTLAGQVHHAETDAGYAHSYPYAISGLTIGGDPHFVQCVDNGFKHLDDCWDLRVCIIEGNAEQAEWERLLPARNLVYRNGTSLLGLAEGDCNVLTKNAFLLNEASIRKTGYAGNYTIGKTLVALEPTTAVMRADDPVFADFVSAVLHSLFAAEKYNISKSTASQFPQTTVFGEEYKDLFRNAIGAVGTFGELRFRNLGLPTRPLVNQVNNRSTGLIFPYPLGFANQQRGGRPLGPAIVEVLERGTLRCGILSNRTGFATSAVDAETGIASYSGMDVDFCSALAASLFWGDTSSVIFVELTSTQDGFRQLAANELDVMAGASVTLENDVREPATGLGFAFSKPYFYGYSDQEDNFCLVTRQEDHDWASFVHWVNMATVYAEQRNITRMSSNQMPEIFVFGSEFKRMFRDAILAVGKYGEIYSRNVESAIPRGGRNMLNANPHLGPQHYIIPGYV